MCDADPDRADDPWMTIAEFAAETRVRPVTVRSWIAKGQLRATRAGQRKWLVRRSELSRMLHRATSRMPPRPRRRRVGHRSSVRALTTTHPRCGRQMVEQAAAAEREQLDHDYAFAAYEWEIAIEQSRMAPPDPRFASRIRHIAEAAGASRRSNQRLHE